MNLQQDILKLLVENNVRGKKCEKMLQSITETILTNNLTMSISDIINDDAGLSPEYFPAQTLTDFHAAEQKWKTDKEYRERVVSNA